MNYKIILALDPSGSYTEGKGTTGWCVYDCSAKRLIHAGSLYAAQYPTMEDYWNKHLGLIQKYQDKYRGRIGLVCEDYILYAAKANSQINSRMETPKLIGILQHYCWQNKLPYCMQLASEVKTRWTDEILHAKGIIIKKGNGYAMPVNREPIDRHCKDSIRHAVHFATFKNDHDNQNM
jgi:hypothetical protein